MSNFKGKNVLREIEYKLLLNNKTDVQKQINILLHIYDSTYYHSITN